MEEAAQSAQISKVCIKPTGKIYNAEGRIRTLSGKLPPRTTLGLTADKRISLYYMSDTHLIQQH